MDDLDFSVEGYVLKRMDRRDRDYFLYCMEGTILPSVGEQERRMADLWIEDILSIADDNFTNGKMSSEAFKLLNNGKEAGMIWVGRSRDQYTCDDTGYLLGIYVEEEERGRGIGKALLSAAEDWCRRKGLMSMTVNVGSVNMIASELYRTSGYEEQSVVMKKMFI